ncbi:hypothetical protein ACFL1H_01480 [Nanoarchaeota archaeon]
MVEEKEFEKLKKELSKLPPKERVQKLKELEEKRKKELEEAEQLIEETVTEIHEKEQEKLEEEEQVIKQEEERKKRQEEDLDEKLEDVKPQKQPEQKAVYGNQQIANIYHGQGSIKDMTSSDVYYKVQELEKKSIDGTITNEEAQLAQKLSSEFEHTNPYQTKTAEEYLSSFNSTKQRLSNISKYHGDESADNKTNKDYM